MIRQSITVDVDALNEDALTIPCHEIESIKIRAAGTYVLNLIAQVSHDASNWTSIEGYSTLGGVVHFVGGDSANAPTVEALYPTRGAKYFRLLCNSYTSGTMTAIISIRDDMQYPGKTFDAQIRQQNIFTTLNAGGTQYVMSNGFRTAGVRGLVLQYRYTVPAAPVAIRAILMGAAAENSAVNAQIPLAQINVTTGTGSTNLWNEHGFFNSSFSSVLAASELSNTPAATLAYGNLTDANGVSVNWSSTILTVKSDISVPFCYPWARIIVYNTDGANNLTVGASRILVIS